MAEAARKLKQTDIPKRIGGAGETPAPTSELTPKEIVALRRRREGAAS